MALVIWGEYRFPVSVIVETSAASSQTLRNSPQNPKSMSSLGKQEL